METFLTISLYILGVLSLIFALAFLIQGRLIQAIVDVIIGSVLLICASDRNEIYPKIDLPEEYSQIKESDTLKGYYDSKGTLHIEFNNKRNQR